MVRAYRDRSRAVWLREVEAEVIRFEPTLAGRMDWDTATFLFNQGRTVAQAVEALLDTSR